MSRKKLVVSGDSWTAGDIVDPEIFGDLSDFEIFQFERFWDFF